MPYFGRAPTGTGAANKIEGDLKVTGTISGESINGKMGLDATDGSASNLDDHITIEDGGTDGSGTNAGDEILLDRSATPNVDAGDKIIQMSVDEGDNILFENEPAIPHIQQR